MSFFSRDYELFLLLAAPGAPGLWQSEQWAPLAAGLAPVLAQTRSKGKAGVRSHQYNPQGKSLAFGRMGWDDRSHAKWTHGPDGTDARFMSMEAWAPTWTVCEKEQLAPDLYLSLANEALLNRPDQPLLFGQRLVCAVATDLGPQAAARARQALAALAVRQQAVLFAHTRRPWGHAAFDGFSQAIQDLLIGGLFQPGDVHARPLDAASLCECWTRLDRRPPHAADV